MNESEKNSNNSLKQSRAPYFLYFKTMILLFLLEQNKGDNNYLQQQFNNGN